MRNLNFEELMDIAFKARKKKDLETLGNVNEEFLYRVERRKKLNKRPMKTSSAGLEQTNKWIEELKNK